MAKNNKYMLVSIGVFILNTLCCRHLFLHTYIFSFLTLSSIIYNI